MKRGWPGVLVTAWIWGFWTACAGPAAGQQAAVPGAAEKIDTQKLGPQVGTAVPDFNLPDQRSQHRTLQSIFGPKGAVLVFFRSADW